MKYDAYSSATAKIMKKKNLNIIIAIIINYSLIIERLRFCINCFKNSTNIKQNIAYDGYLYRYFEYQV